MSKSRIIFLIECIIAFALCFLLLIILTGGFSWSIGRIRISAHGLAIPAARPCCQLIRNSKCTNRVPSGHDPPSPKQSLSPRVRHSCFLSLTFKLCTYCAVHSLAADFLKADPKSDRFRSECLTDQPIRYTFLGIPLRIWHPWSVITTVFPIVWFV